MSAFAEQITVDEKGWFDPICHECGEPLFNGQEAWERDSHIYCSQACTNGQSAAIIAQAKELTFIRAAAADALAFIERHKTSLIGIECNWMEYELAIKPLAAALKRNGSHVTAI